ncbi:hypothetical protein D3C76_1714660 [compost metagenome]
MLDLRQIGDLNLLEARRQSAGQLERQRLPGGKPRADIFKRCLQRLHRIIPQGDNILGRFPGIPENKLAALDGAEQVGHSSVFGAFYLFE